MKASKISKGFFLSILINLLINWMGSIPAWILLALHFWLGVPIFLFWIALFIWFARHFLFVLIMSAIHGFAYKLKDKRNEKIFGNQGGAEQQFSTQVKAKANGNKNPYSSKK